MCVDGTDGFVGFPEGDEFTAAELVLANRFGVGRYDIVNRDVAVNNDQVVVELTVHLYGEDAVTRYWPLPED